MCVFLFLTSCSGESTELIPETAPAPVTHTVVFNLNGGELVSGNLTQTVEEGSAAIAPEVKNGTKTLSWDNDFSNITGTTVVNAVWTANTYTVAFNLNGGELISGNLTQIVEEGSAAIAPEAKNGTKKLSWDNDFSNITNLTIVNAIWTANTYTVTFDPNMEGLSPVQVTAEEGTAAVPPTFTVKGMTLSGWDKDFSNVQSDMNITAQWTKNVLSGQEISDYADSRVVTIYAHDALYDYSSAGSGFFIDDKGTLVTNYHVIEYADSLTIEMTDGAQYTVGKVINFSDTLDIAILQVNITGNDYFNTCSTVAKGERVYAVGSALGTMTGSITTGIVSSPSRMEGHIDCIQMDASISQGNSGGPLLNEFGEVIGINSFYYTNGNNVNFAANINMLEALPKAKNFSISDYVEWWYTETSRSYLARNMENLKAYKYTLVNTYQHITGTKCSFSMTDIDANKGNNVEGYNPEYYYYLYTYDANSYDKYIKYLKSLGYDYSTNYTETYSDGSVSAYTNQTTGIGILLIQFNDSVYGVETLLIGLMY